MDYKITWDSSNRTGVLILEGKKVNLSIKKLKKESKIRFAQGSGTFKSFPVVEFFIDDFRDKDAFMLRCVTKYKQLIEDGITKNTVIRLEAPTV